MIHVFNDKEGASYRVNTDLIAVLKIRISSLPGHVDCEFLFSGGAMLKIDIQNSVFQKFLDVLHKDDEHREMLFKLEEKQAKPLEPQRTI